MSSNITSETNEGVTLITIQRAERKNAVDRATAAELYAAVRAFEADDAAKVMVLTGSGQTFCAGADLKAVKDGGPNRLQFHGEAPMGPSRLRIDKPAIAAIAGHAVAGGLELALMCDLRVVEEDAVLGVFCRRWGVPLIDGGTVRLPRIIGVGRALDLILTGRAVGADEALSIGLANRVVPKGQSVEVAIALAKEIAQHPELCMLMDRASVYEQQGLALDDALHNEFERGMRVLRTGKVQQGAERFTKRER